MPALSFTLDRPVQSATRAAEATGVVTLVAARLDADDTIQVAVRCPYEPVETTVVAIPAGGAAGARTRRARRRFLESVCWPSFEGWALLYGRAQLTVAEVRSGDDGCPHKQVLDFDPLEADPADEPA